MADAAEALWRFSLAFYARPGVAATCLELQDRAGHDVNLLLYACWLGLSGRGRLTAQSLVAAEDAARPWREAVIAPIRAARRAVKQQGAAPELYEQAKALELAAERGALSRLEKLAPPEAIRAAPQRREDAMHNLDFYLKDASQTKDALITAIADWPGE
jgi:uncharacterized protein (TIGR02444 family)